MENYKPTQILKTLTAESHHKVESAMRIMKEDFTRAEYISLLKKFYGFFHPIENMLFPRLGILNTKLNFNERTKTNWLLEDLRYLGISDADVLLLPKCQLWFKNLNQCEILGLMYVIEGSTLGGRIISKQIKEHLNIEVNHGGNFFYSYGKEIGNKWIEFQNVLNQTLRTPEEINYSTEQANLAFHHLGAWLNTADKVE